MQTIFLTADEVLVLTDRVRNDATGTEPHTLQAFPLLLRLGSAYVDMLGDGRREGVISVAVSESEAWLLRSLVVSGDKSSSDALFGVRLLTKLYKILLAYNDPAPDLPAAETNGQEMTAADRAALNRWSEPYRREL